MGSASELEYHLLLARDLKLIKPKDYADLTQRTIEVKRILLKYPYLSLNSSSSATIRGAAAAFPP